MAIKKSTAFTASDGSLCATLEEAQRHELALLFIGDTKPVTDDLRREAIQFACMVQNASNAILDILTTGPRSRPAARKSKGTVNPKRAAKAATPAEKAAGAEVARAGFKAMHEAADAKEVIADA